MAERTTTPQLETLRKEQKKKKQNSVDPTHILDKAIYQLWETINDLDQIQPERVEHYRVSIFGSSRIRRGDPIYEEVKKLTYELARMGIDIVTGGGPGLMEAANAGAMEGQVDSKARSFGLAIHLPTEETPNPFVNKVFRHRTFFSRLHHFVRLSSAFIVFPGSFCRSSTCASTRSSWSVQCGTACSSGCAARWSSAAWPVRPTSTWSASWPRRTKRSPSSPRRTSTSNRRKKMATQEQVLDALKRVKF